MRREDIPIATGCATNPDDRTRVLVTIELEYETVDARHLVELIEEYAVASEAPQSVGTTMLGKEGR
jgi:hypothetical protein